MPRIVKQLTDVEIKKAKPKDKEYKLSDGQGLYLVIRTNGTKFFRFDFSFGGKRRSMSFGVYPTISLKEARDKRDEAKNLIANNINPINQKKLDKDNQKLTFKFITEQWLKSINKKLAATTAKNYEDTLRKNVYPAIGHIEAQNIKRIDIVNTLNKMKLSPATAKRIFNLLTRIYSFATISYNLEKNPIDFRISDIITTSATKNHTAIIQKDEISELINKIKNLKVGDKEYLHYSPIYALKMLPYMFVRISSLVQSEWDHIDFEHNTWYFPAENMKTKKEYLYPMPTQVVDLLLDLNEYLEQSQIKSKYIFHSAHNKPEMHLSRTTVASYLTDILDYKGKMTLHGFRSTFSTTAYENDELHGFNSAIIEACLSHQDKNKIRSAYNRDSLEKYINQKRALIRWYADYLDTL